MNDQRVASAGFQAARTLHIETRGEGPEVVLVHGWGLHGGVWADVVDTLAARLRVSVVDLPGHGFSSDDTGFDLPRVAAALAAALPGARYWIGWSLGATLCLQVALNRPQQVRGLGLVAATPRFTSAADWACGVAPEVLQRFSQDLEQDPDAVLMRFLALQVQGAQRAQGALRTLRAHWSQRPAARPQGLRCGLAILRETDLRPRLGEIHAPALVMAGERDRLVPPEASAQLAEALHHARLETVAGAGHAPFVAQPLQVARLLSDFVEDQIDCARDTRP